MKLQYNSAKAERLKELKRLKEMSEMYKKLENIKPNKDEPKKSN